ncbi:uncharacterized protein LOC109405537 isoform X3 [Aedes albopictus]|uniref:Secreted protein n=1 Tax=Aedes albopictus TaxID=7160 RepID=A0ABM1ZPS8_AEDAL|nr:uncharacterized protein LOC109405537 isoform X3 [Aedes albopictus]
MAIFNSQYFLVFSTKTARNRQINKTTVTVPMMSCFPVSTYSCNHKCKRKKTPSASTLSLTPAQDRFASEDMEAVRLRLSRNDNPFIQKVLASRESVLDYADDTESDDAILILMTQDLQDPNSEADPLSLPQVHEHMVRSPPPAFWPRSPRSSVFNFIHNADIYQEDNGNTSGSNDGNQLSLREERDFF